jgi:hypothetical protein
MSAKFITQRTELTLFEHCIGDETLLRLVEREYPSSYTARGIPIRVAVAFIQRPLKDTRFPAVVEVGMKRVAIRISIRQSRYLGAF